MRVILVSGGVGGFMEIEVQQEKIAKAMGLVSRVAVGAKSTLPILANVLIRAEDGKVSLTTTNLDMAIVDFVPVVKSKDGVITVPARILAEFVGNLPRDEVVKMKLNGTSLEISAGRYRSKINGATADDFPELPGIDEKKVIEYKMPIEEFKVGVGEVIMATSGDTTRPALTGVCFNTANDSLFIAATDGYRLAEKKFIEKVKSEVRAIVPREAMQEVLRSITDEMDDIAILFDENQVKFRLGEIEITSKLIDGVYPDYQKLFPGQIDVELIVDKGELLRMVRMAQVFARQTDGAVSLRTSKEEKRFIVSSITNEAGENESEIEIEATDDVSVRIVSRYLIDAINALEEGRVKIGFQNKPGPILVENVEKKDYRHIVMPLA